MSHTVLGTGLPYHRGSLVTNLEVANESSVWTTEWKWSEHPDWKAGQVSELSWVEQHDGQASHGVWSSVIAVDWFIPYSPYTEALIPSAISFGDETFRREFNWDELVKVRPSW